MKCHCVGEIGAGAWHGPTGSHRGFGVPIGSFRNSCRPPRPIRVAQRQQHDALQSHPISAPDLEASSSPPEGLHFDDFTSAPKTTVSSVWTLPTVLTTARVLAIPVFTVLWYSAARWAPLATTCVFVGAAATDWLDGYLARRLGCVSEFGAFLDPVADKLMVAVALVLMAAAAGTESRARTVCAAAIVCREIAMSALREWAAGAGAAARGAVAVSLAGKLKTTVQLAALSTLCFARAPSVTPVLQALGTLLLVAATALTVWSAADYFRQLWPFMAGRRCPRTGRVLD